MKNTSKITLCAMMAALACAVMLFSFFPYLTYAIPAIAGLFVMVVVIEINCSWAVLTYLASALIVLFFPEPESKILYATFFGFYTIIKALAEKLRKPLLEWIIKMAVFNTAIVIVYFVFANFIGFSLEELGFLGKYGAIILWLFGNIVFVVYDIALSRFSMMYMAVIHPKIKRLMK